MTARLRRLIRAALAALLFGSLVAPAAAALNPVLTYVALPGSPGVGRLVFGTITLGASDTYAAGGITVTPQMLGGQVAIQSMVTDTPSQAFESNATVQSNGSANILFTQALNGASQVLATATTAVVTVPNTTGANVLTANTHIECTLNNAATAGGGTGTWAVTNAVSTCQFTSATTFTITVIAAAPTNGGNFTWYIPALTGQMNTGFNVAGVAIPFVAIVS